MTTESFQILYVRYGMSQLRGWIGEKKTAFYLWFWLSSKRYKIFNDIIIPSKNGTSQIDHLIISIYGIFIVETKNKKGWIFGSEHGAKWTQVIYKNKYQFQNPLKQTFRQKKILAEFLSIEESKIFTVVYFVGDCTFKTDLPSNVVRSRVSRYIKRFKDQVLSNEDVRRVISTIKNHISESSVSNRDHIKSLQVRHSSSTTCPKCGSPLIERTAKKGANAGKKFLGCGRFPKCRFSRSYNI